MANLRIARFVMEAAPPQFVSVMRHRTSQMLDTISEEERDVGLSGPRRSPPKSLASCTPQFVSVMRHRTLQMLDTISEEERDVGLSGPRRSPPKSLASCSPSSPTTRASATTSFGTAAAKSGNFFRGADRSLSMFES